MPGVKVARGKMILKKFLKVTCPYCDHRWEEPWQKVEDNKRSSLCPNCGNGIYIICPEVD